LIDDEDDLDILKKGVSWKGVLKNIVVIAMILLGAFFIYTGYEPETSQNIFIGFMMICMGATLMQIQKSPPEPIRQTLSILTCSLCSLVKVRNYNEGDFVFKQSKDKCTKCDKPMEIKQIYSVRLKRPTVDSTQEKEKEKKVIAGPGPF